MSGEKKETWFGNDMVFMPRGERSRTIGGMHGAVPMEQEAPPSSYAMASVINREKGALWRVFGVTALRTVFIIPGLWAASRFMPEVSRTLKGWRLVGLGLGMSTSISAGMLAFYGIKSKLAADSGSSSENQEGVSV